MLRLTVKNYMLHLKYSVLLILQMIIVLFIMDQTFIEMVNQIKTLDNITFEKNLYFVENTVRPEQQFLEDVTEIVGKSHVGYMYRIGTIGIEEKNELEVPPLEYINSTMENIHYALKEGKNFSNKENEVILGGKIAVLYDAGDEIVLTRNGKKKKVVVTGILKSPGKCVHLTENSAENLFSCVNKGQSVMLTNSKELLEWASSDSVLEADTLVVDMSDKKSNISKLQKKYNVISLEKAKSNGKKEIIKNTAGNVLYMCVLLGIALVSVSIQIYMYLRRNKEEYQLYRMLGLGRVGIFVIWCTQHIVNLGIVAIVLYVISELTEKSSYMTGTVNWTKLIFYVLYCLLYLTVTILVFKVTSKGLERKEAD